MERQEIKRVEVCRFFALRESGNAIEFIVFNDGTMDCSTLGLKCIRAIDLKPEFVLECDGFVYKYTEQDKVVGFEVNEAIKAYMEERGMTQPMPYGFDNAEETIKVVSARAFAKKAFTNSK